MANCSLLYVLREYEKIFFTKLIAMLKYLMNIDIQTFPLLLCSKMVPFMMFTFLFGEILFAIKLDHLTIRNKTIKTSKKIRIFLNCVFYPNLCEMNCR